MSSTKIQRPGHWWSLPAKGLGLLVGLQFIFFGLLVTAQAVPDRPIINQLLASIDAGTYGPVLMPDRMGGTSDTFTECVLVSAGLGAPPDESAFSRAARMPRIASCEGGIADLRGLENRPVLSAEELPVDHNYFRYWNGYTVLTRPLLALIGLEGLRIVSGSLMMAAFIGALLAIRARTSTLVALAITTPFMVGTNMLSTPSTSFSHSLAIAAMYLSVILTALGSARSNRLGYFGAGLGAAVFCYVDLLTTPAVPWMTSAFALGVIVWFRTRDVGQTFVATLVAGTVWAISFIFTWASRWAFAALLLGTEETFAVVGGKVEERTGGAWDGVSETFGAGITGNISYWWNTVPTSGMVLAACMLTIVVAMFLAAARGGRSRLAVAAILAAPAVVAPVWYAVLSNHSQIHEFFVYRSVPAALAVVSAAAVAAAVRAHSDEDDSAESGPLEPLSASLDRPTLQVGSEHPSR